MQMMLIYFRKSFALYFYWYSRMEINNHLSYKLLGRGIFLNYYPVNATVVGPPKSLFIIAPEYGHPLLLANRSVARLQPRVGKN